jgi:predicted MPP superfamily phosphohydrolase
MGRLPTFIVIALCLLAAIHYYLWARLIRDPQLPPRWRPIASTLLFLLAASMPVALVLGRAHPGIRRLLSWPAFLWMGIMFLLLVTLLSTDLARLLWRLGRRAIRALSDADAAPTAGPQLSLRRTFLARSVAAGASLAVAGLTLSAIRSARGPIGVRKVRVRLDRLPAAQDGFTIAQITDVHVGATIGRSFIEEIVRQTNELSPDLIAITGDLVDGTVEQLGHLVEPLRNLRARHGVFFVSGNHEYFSAPEEWFNELPQLGIRVLRNERLPIGNAAGSFDLAGIDDRSAVHYGGLGPRQALAQALTGRDPRRELVLLAHQPSVVVEAEPFQVGLQLSGHTHGGQIWPFGYLVRLQQPFIAGLHRRGDSQIYVSRGTGYWGPPMRVGAPPEITEIRLERMA